MASTATGNNETSAILERVIRPHGHDLSPAGARALLKLQFDEHDRSRMHELAAKNQQGKLTEAERDELQIYVHVGLVLDLLQAKARRILKRSATRS
jgi:hypothetical protein